MLPSALSLVDPPTVARYEAMWWCYDSQFRGSIGYFREFERSQAAGAEPQRRIWACRRAEDRKRAADHIGGPRTFSKSDADVTRQLKLSGEIRRATSLMAQGVSRNSPGYLIDDMKLPANWQVGVPLIVGRLGGNWGCDVAHIYGRTKDTRG